MGCFVFFIFFFNDTATTEIYTYGHTLSLHDALPIYHRHGCSRHERHHALDLRVGDGGPGAVGVRRRPMSEAALPVARSEEHTSELQSLMRISYAVFCLKKKKKK